MIRPDWFDLVGYAVIFAACFGVPIILGRFAGVRTPRSRRPSGDLLADHDRDLDGWPEQLRVIDCDVVDGEVVDKPERPLGFYLERPPTPWEAERAQEVAERSIEAVRDYEARGAARLLAAMDRQRDESGHIDGPTVLRLLEASVFGAAIALLVWLLDFEAVSVGFALGSLVSWHRSGEDCDG